MASQTSESGSNLPRLERGTTVRDTYRVQRWLGEGAFGTVYLVRHRFLGPQALKLLSLADGMESDEALREGAILAQLTDPHVVRVFDADLWQVDGREVPFLTMEYLSGGTLADLLARRTRLPIDDAIRVAKQLLAGLSAAHRLSPPVLHRDITPGNILVVAEQPLTVKLGDFGLAGHIDPVARLMRAAGTVRYQPPEAAWGYATEATDLYAIALILYEMLTGAAAFPLPAASELRSGDDVAAAIRRVDRSQFHPPSELRSRLPPWIDAVLDTALAESTSHRFASADSFREALEGAA